ncbi:MAG: DUF1830 domain-containing protein [Chroococcidiopsidaceae cyanobacterium CP_BM_ER_R8_30]|nr:DUF1830 domain-containing protein [Chroococcidiopsidaceae cyanobacterium CP_BM_ER_R8_30]
MNFFDTQKITVSPKAETPGLDPLPLEVKEPILCHYTNSTSKLQIARVTNISGWYFERVLFSGQHLLFEAPRLAELEIYSGELSSIVLVDKIPCEHLWVIEEAQKEDEP